MTWDGKKSREDGRSRPRRRARRPSWSPSLDSRGDLDQYPTDMPSSDFDPIIADDDARRIIRLMTSLERMASGSASEISLEDEDTSQSPESDEGRKTEPNSRTHVNQLTSNAEPEARTYIRTSARPLGDVRVEIEVAGSVEPPDELGEVSSIDEELSSDNDDELSSDNDKELSSDDDKVSQDNGQHLFQDHSAHEQQVEDGTRVAEEQVAQVEAPVGKELPGCVEQPETLAEANPTNDRLLPNDNEDLNRLQKRIEELEKVIVHKNTLVDEYEVIVNQDSSKDPRMEGAPRTNLTLLREARQTERGLKAELKDLGVQFDNLILARDARDKTIKELGDASRKYQLEKGKLTEEIKSLRDKVAQLETSNADFLRAFSNLEKKISALQAELSDRKVELKESDSLLTTVRDELRIAKKMLRECEYEKVTYVEQAALIDSLRDDLADQERYNAVLRMQIMELYDKIEQEVEERQDDGAEHDWEIQEERDSFARSDGKLMHWGRSVSSILDSPVCNTSLPPQQSRIRPSSVGWPALMGTF